MRLVRLIVVLPLLAVVMATMPTIAELSAEAQALGLKGDDVTSFVYRQQEFYRDERAADRAAAQFEREALEREKVREHELRMQEIRSQGEPARPLECVSKTRLPMYKDGDEITAFIIRFERLAELLQIDRESYAVRLGSLLTGRALNVYVALPPEVTSDYDSLKKALLDGFSKNHESYRSEFRKARLGPNETYAQFSVHLGRLLDYWLESRNVDKSYDALRSFLISDQLMSAVPPPLRLYLKEHDAQSLPELVRLAWGRSENAPQGEKCNR